MACARLALGLRIECAIVQGEVPRVAEECAIEMPATGFVFDILRWGGFALGIALTLAAWRSVISTVVQPRSGASRITWVTWRTTQGAFLALARHRADYARKDALLSLLAPVALMAMLAVWLFCFLLGYALIFWPLLPNASLGDALSLSGASLFTLGASITLRGAPTAIEFIAAGTGMIVVALQIGYLPAIYSAYNRREALVTALSIRGGAPNWGPELLARHSDAKSRATLAPLYAAWESWSANIMESHTSYPWLISFRSPEPLHSWVIGLLAVLDSAALYLALAPDEAPAEALQCLQAGIIALQRVHSVTHGRGQATENDTIKLSLLADTESHVTLPYERFTYGVAHITSAGFPATRSIEDAWLIFSGWRAQYEAQAYTLADHVVAPPAPWSGTRTHMSRSEASATFASRTQPPLPIAPLEQTPSASEAASDEASDEGERAL